MRRRRSLFGLGTVTLTAALTALTLAGGALAVHWPFFGGDPGRSGYQPVEEAGVPIQFAYSKLTPTDDFVKTSILTSAGMPDTQRVIYGTVDPPEVMAGSAANNNGRVHLRILATGAAVGGSELGVLIDNGNADADVFGPGAAAPAPASVSFGETSSATGLGQVFAVHNDDDQSTSGDIAIAQIAEDSGTLVKDVAVSGTNGYSLASSILLTGPGANGDRSLFFVATSGTTQALFKVAIGNAGATAATIGGATSTTELAASTTTGDIDADPQASPTLAFLAGSAAAPTAYVLVGTGAPDNRLESYAVADLAAGPASAALGGSVQTPSIPVQPTGTTPSPGTDVTTAPVIYVAAATGATTTVYALRQQGGSQTTLTMTATSEALPGAPAPALATTQEAGAGGLTPGKVIVTTGRNVFLLDTAALGRAGTFDRESDLEPGSTGFGQTTAAASGELVYVTTDEGRQLILRLADAQPVPSASFAENAGNSGNTGPDGPSFDPATERLDNSGMGQPSLSRGFVQFGSQKGLFVYRGTAPGTTPPPPPPPPTPAPGACANRQVGTARNDVLRGTAFGDRIFGLEGNDAITGLAGSDCLEGGSGSDRLAGGDGVDRLTGGPGADRLDGGSGSDRGFGSEGSDSLVGGAGNDLLDGGVGNDSLSGGAGNDLLIGGQGNDRITGGPGADRVSGGIGNDTINARDGVRENVSCGSGRDTAIVDRLDRTTGCERVSRR